MRYKLLMSMVALIMASMVGIAAGLAWGQNEAGCDSGYEGDHGRGCIPTTKEECNESAWEAFDVFDYLFENVGACNK